MKLKFINRIDQKRGPKLYKQVYAFGALFLLDIFFRKLYCNTSFNYIFRIIYDLNWCFNFTVDPDLEFWFNSKTYEFVIACNLCCK